MNRKKKKILIVDDEHQVIQMLSDLLVSWGYQVRGAQSAHEALDTFSGNDFNLVIADFRMPEMDGFEFMQKLRELDPQCPFIFLTGDASEETAVKTLEAGADDYLVKPVNSSEFRIRIERCLKHHTHIKRLPVLRGVNWALIIAIPLWLILGYIIAKFFIK